MGTFSFANAPVLSILFAPAQALAAWFVPAQKASRQFAVPAGAPRMPSQLALPFSSTGTSAGTFSGCRPVAAKPAGINSKAPTPSRLKVVREFDSAVGPACAGRMVISGRMADVCAELDRLAQRDCAAL